MSGAGATPAKRRDALRECLEETIGRDLAEGVTRTALRLASADEPPTDDHALRLYVEGPLATAVAEALGQDAATAFVHIVRARLFPSGTMPPPPRTESADMPKTTTQIEVATISAIRRSDKRFNVALRCADALRRSETARVLVQSQCDVTLVFGVDDVAKLRGSRTHIDLAVFEIDGIDAERALRELTEASNPAVIALVEGEDTREVVRVLRAAGVDRFNLLQKRASARELMESVSELLVGFVRSR